MNNSDAVIYARYSSHAQRDVSIEQQIRACKQFAQRQKLTVREVYEDRALSGTSDKRPGFQKMIQDAKHADWSYVIVYTLDRFARDRYDSAVYKRQLKNCNVKVLSATENISDDPTGVLMESLLEGLAEYYSKELSRKVQRGHQDNARKCMVNGALPLGYVKGPDNRYQIEETEAQTVREIFRRVRSGDQMIQIIDDLNARGIYTKKGKLWNRSSFNQLLSNERYTGVYIYGDIRIAGGVPAIVSQSLFDEVQERIYRKRNPRRDPTGQRPQRRRREAGTYLLTGKLFCGHCKAPMIGVSGTSRSSQLHFYYKCRSRHADPTSCHKKNIRRDDIELFVARTLRETMFTEEAMHALADAAIAYQQRSDQNLEIEALKNQLNDTNRALSNLMAAIEAGIFSATTQTRLVELEAQQRDLTRRLNAASAEVEEALTKEEILAVLDLYRTGDVLDKDYQEALIDTFLVSAYLYDGYVKFVVKLDKSTHPITLPFDIDAIPAPDVRITEQPFDHNKKDC